VKFVIIDGTTTVCHRFVPCLDLGVLAALNCHVELINWIAD